MTETETASPRRERPRLALLLMEAKFGRPPLDLIREWQGEGLSYARMAARCRANGVPISGMRLNQLALEHGIRAHREYSYPESLDS